MYQNNKAQVTSRCSPEKDREGRRPKTAFSLVGGQAKDIKENHSSPSASLAIFIG